MGGACEQYAYAAYGIRTIYVEALKEVRSGLADAPVQEHDLNGDEILRTRRCLRGDEKTPPANDA